MTKKVIEENTIRLWVREALNKNLSEASDDDDDLNIKKTSKRRMEPYKGAEEHRDTPKTTISNIGRESGSGGSELDRVLNVYKDPKVKIGKSGFKGSSEEGYEEFKPDVSNPSNTNTGEFTDDELPIVSRGDGSQSGVLLDIKKGLDKIHLSLGRPGASDEKGVPEFVLQMFKKAVDDYKELLDDYSKILKLAAIAYRNYLKTNVSDRETSDAALYPVEQGDVPVEPEELQFTEEDLDALDSDKGLALLTTLDGFKEFFDKWKMGSWTSERGDVASAPPKVAKAFRERMIRQDRIDDAFLIAKVVKTLDVHNEEPSSIDMADRMGLETNFEPDFTKVDAFLILQSPNFRYFVNNQGGKNVNYWNWVRNQAEKIGKYKGQF
jgi:hypothetical protein